VCIEYCSIYITLTQLAALFSAHTGTCDLKPAILTCGMCVETKLWFGTVAAFHGNSDLWLVILHWGPHTAFVQHLLLHLLLPLINPAIFLLFPLLFFHSSVENS
jgi:hypothetical protein